MSQAARRLTRLAGNAGSQGLNSLGSLILVMLAARAGGTAEFGIWSLFYATYTAVLTLSRALVSTPLLIGHEVGRALHREEINGTSAAFCFGLLVALMHVPIVVLASGNTRQVALSFTVAIPLFLAHDALRYVFFKREHAGPAIILDLVVVLGQVAAFLALNRLGEDGPSIATYSRALAVGLCLIPALFLMRFPIMFNRAVKFFRRHRFDSTRLGLEALLGTASALTLPTLLAATVGVVAAGSLRAGTTIMGGIALVVLAFTPVATVEAAKLARLGSNLRRFLIAWNIFTFASSLIYGGAILLLPDGIGRSFLGDSWEGGRAIAPALLIQAALRGPFTGVPIALRAMHALQDALRLRVQTTIVNMTVPAVAGIAYGLSGAVWGIVAAAIVNDIQSVAAMRRIRSVTPSVVVPYR